ncbi:MAG: nickel transporter [Rhodobacterales bacterium]|nr:MAG: nickel transporter [Rhodobacterales bacterium]
MKTLLLAAAAAIALPATASAHFLLQYTGDTQIANPGDVPMKLIFWHPFENGHVMDMGMPQEFFMIHNGEKTDLSGRLVETTFKGAENEAIAYDATVPVKRSGDYVVVTVPAPYYEESEDIYIQQITKSFLNRNEMPTDWDTPVGLPTEIIPLSKPYNIIAGSNFAGRVVANGEPVAGAEIEIEYVASEPDMKTGSTTAPSVGTMPGGAVVAISDKDGYFSFAVPRAGHWGFAALGSGPVTEYEGKELSQDAVIWIRAYDLE